MSLALRVACPACGRDDWRPSLDAGSHRLLKCRCGLRALDGFGADAFAANESMYGGEEYNEWYRSVRVVLLARYARDCSEIERYAARGTILDVGCSYGWFLDVARTRGWHPFGIEVTDATARPAREAGLDVRTGTLQEASFSDESFDVVCLWDVLEHVPQIDEFLTECRRVLAPGGLLALQSPNIRSVMARQAGADWSWLLLPQHVWHFTPSSIRAVLGRRGFEVARQYTWEPPEALFENLSLYKRHPGLARSRGARRVSDRLIGAAEKVWCRAGYGGLLRVYARRTA